jgi:diphosphomevalonate decarboxylase
MMHSVMMTSSPPLHYWMPASLDVMHAVRSWRAEKLSACCTVDAGANVHVLCPEKDGQEIARRLKAIPGVKDVLNAGVGGPAKLIEETPAHSPRAGR